MALTPNPSTSSIRRLAATVYVKRYAYRSLVGSSDFIRARQELVESVEALRSGNGSFVDGIRRLLSLRRALGIADFDADYMVLVAIDSQSDHLPNSVSKLMSTDAWLAQCASEERELKEQNEEAVLAACERLLKRFANEA